MALADGNGSGHVFRSPEFAMKSASSWIGRAKALVLGKRARSADRSPRARAYFYLGESLAMTQLADGHFLFVDPQDRTLSMHLIANGYWEKWIHKVVCNLVRPGDRIIEVGANLGYYTVGLARRVGPTGRIVAIEANPFVASLLGRSVEFGGYLGRVEVIQAAATEHAGPIHFTTSRANSGGGHLGLGWPPHGDQIDVEVQGIRLDDLVFDGPVRLIRIDAEGSEAMVLRGASRLLEQADIIICMEWDVLQMSSRTEVPPFIDWLVELGFRFWRIEKNATLSVVEPQMLLTLSSCDILLSRLALPVA